jgi:hypothetical protein
MLIYSAFCTLLDGLFFKSLSEFDGKAKIKIDFRER